MRMAEYAAEQQQNLSGLQTEQEEWLNDKIAQTEYRDWLDSVERLASPLDANYELEKELKHEQH